MLVRGSTHPFARPAYDAGAADSALRLERLILVLGAAPDQEIKLSAFLDSQHDKTSANYHRWLTPEEFGEQFGPSSEDLQRVTNWLHGLGFRVETVAQSRRWLEFSGTALQVQSAFRTQMRHYQVNGRSHIANATDVSIPMALAPVIRGIASLHDFFSKPLISQKSAVRRDSRGFLVPADPQFTARNGTVHFLAPGDFASIYNLSPLYQNGFDGSGQAIAIVARQNLALFDVQTFRQIFGLPANDPNIIINGSVPDLLPDDSALEATLDTEWAGAVAPKATVTVVVTASTVTSDGADLSAAYIVDHNLAGIMSMSFGACEQALGTAGNSFHNALWQQAAAQGISVFVSTGDNGAAGCDAPTDPLNQPAQGGLAVNALASTPFNTAVGGTQFNDIASAATYWSMTNGTGLASAKGYIPEATWNESCDPTIPNSPCFGHQFGLFAGSGGASTIYAKPSWQAGSGVPADARRDLPDVSLAAAGGHDGYLICFAGLIGCRIDDQGNLAGAGIVGGTSASAPAFAGIIALAAQKAGGRQGLANYVLYRLATGQQNPGNCDSSNQTDPIVRSPCIFNDVTSGDNSVPGQVGFSAQAGFDLATGLGSVDAFALVSAWNSAALQNSATTLASPQTTQVPHGQPVQINVTVTAAAGTSVPTGSVALISDQFGPPAIVSLTNGSFAGPVSSFPGGQYNLSAHYHGDGTFGASDSKAIPINISTENGSVTLSAFTYTSSGPTSVSSLPYGNFVYFHATVASASGNGIPTGTVTFQEGTTVLGSFGVDTNGGAELVSGGFSALGATFCLTLGPHSIAAVYSGDNSFNTATSQPFLFNVTKANNFVNIPNVTPLTLVPGQMLPLLAQVSNSGPILPTGTVQFLDNSIALGSPIHIAPPVPGNEPSAMTQVTLGLGSHSITATYSGDGLYNPSSSLFPLPVTVAAGTGSPSITTLATPSSAASIGQLIHFTAAVTPQNPGALPVPTGTVQINSPLGQLAAPVTLANGAATISVPVLIAGSVTYFLQYSGDSTYAPSGSNTVTVTVPKATPSLALTSSAPAVAPGKPVSLVSKLNNPSRAVSVPSDMVQYFDAVDGAPAQPIGGPHFLTFGTAPFTEAHSLSAVLPVGTNVITAQFLGDSNLNPATSNPVTVVVGNTFQFSISSNNLVVAAGQAGSVILTVAPIGVFNAATTLSCGSALPSEANCSISPTSVTPNGAPATATLTLSTVAPKASVLQQHIARSQIWPGFGGSVALAGLILIGWSRRRNMFGPAICAMFAAVIFVIFGCGGAGGPSPPPGPASTTTALSSSAIKTPQGNAVTLTATVSSVVGGATGSVTFFDAGVLIGQPASLSGGTAQMQANSLSVGTHNITANYGGDPNHSASTSAGLQQVITGTTQLQITASGGGQSQSLQLSVVIQ